MVLINKSRKQYDKQRVVVNEKVEFMPTAT